MFLTDDELEELTGYKSPPKQREWLLSRRYAFEVNARNRPKVLRSVVEHRLGGDNIDRPREPRLRLP
ncbi:hypothetical protein J2T57_002646 [Natronocella acetinitrilica]|uniref:DUF4224 domain-containing protein n=1 Tax=Natronocella acetinitrilica TaxID=414046 RepID=A0AAE3G484_9GAMM|nr:DUF4224 domain-containing protein [Natronocella acetinitrilica]MCP1675496.1 hypothetical protein [Natronocella acetinitrilica]